MNAKTLKRNTALAMSAALLAMIGSAAHAGTLTMQGWLYGPGNQVSLSANPNYNGLAGGFKGRLSGLSDSQFNLNPVEMYCVDLAQFININATYTVKLQSDNFNANFTIKPVNAVFSSAISQRLTQLVSWSESAASYVDNSTESTALQLAIWNAIYEVDGDQSGQALRSGSFRETLTQASVFATTAGSMQASAASYQGRMKQLFVLQSGTNQDQLIWIDSQNSVPVPGTLALVGLALLGAGAAARRRG